MKTSASSTAASSLFVPVIMPSELKTSVGSYSMLTLSYVAVLTHLHILYSAEYVKLLFYVAVMFLKMWA
jgi:hypothetical protein